MQIVTHLIEQASVDPLQKAKDHGLEHPNALHMAAMEGHANVVNYLLTMIDHDSVLTVCHFFAFHLTNSLTHFVQSGKTALHLAASRGHHSVIAILMQHHVNIHTLDKASLSNVSCPQFIPISIERQFCITTCSRQ